MVNLPFSTTSLHPLPAASLGFFVFLSQLLPLVFLSPASLYLSVSRPCLRVTGSTGLVATMTL